MPNQKPTQQTTQPMSHGDLKASMGVATFLQSHLIPQQGQQQQPQAPQTPEIAPETPTNQTTPSDTSAEMQGLESRIMDELGTLKAEIEKTQPQDANKELQNLKTELQALLDSKDE